MPFGTEIGLGPGHIVLDGDPTTPKEKGTAAPAFRPVSVVPSGWTIRIPLGTEVGASAQAALC